MSLRDGGWLAPDVTIVLEESSAIALDPPPGFTETEARTYGAATVHFLALGRALE